jgi:transcription antitermination protein NusB
MGSRHRSRELAVQLSYQWELHPSSLDDPKAIDLFWREQALSSDDTREFFEILIRGVASRLPEIDKLIAQYLKSWKMDRLDKVDVALLRVAFYELLFYEGPDPADAAVVINEAIEIAKKFGTPKSAGFVNGVLDNLARERGLLKERNP